MNSKEALEHICKTCDNKSCPWKHYEKSRCAFYGVIKQDLEVLEILKNYSFIDTILKNNYVDIPCDYDVFIVEINSYYNKKHFDKVKEWLKNE